MHLLSKNVNLKSIYKPWITKAVSKSIKTKHRLYSKVLKSNFNPDVYLKYKKYRNMLTTILRNAKKLYYGDLFKKHKGNTRKTWNTINELLGKNNGSKDFVEKLNHKVNDVQIESNNPTEVAEIFNDFFVNVGNNLAQQFPNTNTQFDHYLGDPVPESFFWLPITRVEIENVLKGSNRKKACGHDNVPMNLICDAAEYISQPLSFIFNLSLQSGQFPSCLKIAKVSPVYKKGAKNEPDNDRPISVLLVLSKIFEKISK